MSTPPPLPADAADEKTPVGQLITDREATIVRGSVRSIVKVVVPFLPKIAAAAGPALVVWLLAIVHAEGVKVDTDKQVKKAEATTERAYTAVAEPAKKNDEALAAALAAVTKRLDAMEAVQKAQSAAIPPRARRKVDRELAKEPPRKQRTAPVITPIPLEIPKPPDPTVAPVKPADPAP